MPCAVGETISYRVKYPTITATGGRHAETTGVMIEVATTEVEMTEVEMIEAEMIEAEMIEIGVEMGAA